jgi:hypothetical protein
MKTKSLLVLMLAWLMGTVSMAVAQAPAIAHNTWSSGAPLPTAVFSPATAMLKGKIYVIGGTNADGTVIADTQIYDPATDTWSAGVPLPTPLVGGAGAVVNGVLYVMGGISGQTQDYTDAVWAFSLKTGTWSAKAAMPTALNDAGVAVVNNIIYLVGGNASGDLRTTTVESYNPATDTWTKESPLLLGRSEPSVGRLGNKLVGFKILAAGGTIPTGWTKDTESYDVFTKTWISLTPDPKARAATCTGAVGLRLYRAGGLGGDWGRPISLTERFSLSKNNWKTLASIPQPVALPGSAVYKGRLYCLGGMYDWIPLSNVQIYQP